MNEEKAARPEALEIYPSELPKIKATLADLQSRWLQKTVSEPTDAAEAFNQQAANEFLAIGFEVEVNWLQAEENPFAPGVPLYVPEVNIVGRTKKESDVDHNRLQWEVTHGLVDGKVGYIRSDGSEREDPIKRTIY